MKQSTLLIISFWLTLVLSVLGAYLKILHAPGAEFLLAIVLFATLAYVLLALHEVWSSDCFTHSEKIMWTAAFVLLMSIGGVIYFLMGRRRITRRRPQ
jgi:hypothetical protein